ncbi:hypothetical protein H9Q13_05575 [Pontibacter sp. JH31]|uniref:DUF5777 domain-containing protein n=1 Tax=Pontibacter aquaedesilientis TaxID=2766980 RepID=A0ABR7XEB6_9BACT|nr:DUF5777 family beta-barrel protein [Pontibacter aquaedesilientis]MBD1396629.1 hypothetical protein [Pontibacter aquaedesilientis]
MSLRNKLWLAVLLNLFFCTGSFAQDQELLALLEDSVADNGQDVFATFKTTRIVNSHSIETVKHRGLDFRVTHHFGDVAGGAGGIHSLYGLDQASDIRIAFEYGINDKLTAGFGRSKVNELLDGYLKYRLLSQTLDNRLPVSATVMLGGALNPQKASEGGYNSLEQRLSYTFQLLLARKFERISVQLMPTLLHRNYVFGPDEKNDVFALGVGGRWKMTKRFALLADYFYSFHDDRRTGTVEQYNPLGIGIEIETGGHVFHMFFTNNAGIAESNFLSNTNSSWRKGEFKFGFNISRVFNIGS